MILERIAALGFSMKRMTAGEYAGPCPWCGGRDRFRVWPDKSNSGRYWCRQCGKSGDEIQFLGDYEGMNFKEARELVTGTSLYMQGKQVQRRRKRDQETKTVTSVSTWQQMTNQMVEATHEKLLKHKETLAWLKTDRGLTEKTIKDFRLGWLERNEYRKREEWGLANKLKEDGKPTKLLIPAGLVIPSFSGKAVSGVKFRRSNPGDYGRYYALPGSDIQPWFIGLYDPSKPVVIVESELDGILLYQETGTNTLVLRSATNRPTLEQDKQLSACPAVMVALDTDEAGGKQTWKWWMEKFKNAKRSIIPKRWGKDHTEAWHNGLSLVEWYEAACNLAGVTGGLYEKQQPVPAREESKNDISEPEEPPAPFHPTNSSSLATAFRSISQPLDRKARQQRKPAKLNLKAVKWLKENRAALRAQGWTPQELYRANRSKKGIVFLRLWNNDSLDVSIGKGGRIVFSFTNGTGQIITQTAAPQSNLWANHKLERKK